ncbi:lipopolysaccharide biosynthesis protein [Piscinibacter sakaiensis]|uniref:Polysaccharide biosynthesis protein C-terminal domain-containing protein n=1 Tax=Piscinibacter sakaiensis TaxID=1547922 RepID=A0A0K8NZQ8_PISS1|nr:oligosaccharide flippase family protein [Piscinibacter sakaiensis]GAP35866.1 hypothetical protein ISF6_1639 [Piscinibacter sakaiensis]
MGPRLLSRLGSTLGARLVMAAVNFGLFWALSHTLDVGSLGSYALLMNLFYMAQGLPLLGLSVPLERRAAAQPETLAQELSNALTIALPVGAALGLGIAAWGALAHGPALALPFALLGAAVFVSAWILVAESVLMGREEMAAIARRQCAEAVLRLALALAVIALGGGLAGVMAVFLLLRVGLAAAYLRTGRLPRPRVGLLARAIFRRNLSEMPVYFGIAMLAGIVSRADALVLDRVGGPADVAMYTVASRLYDAALMLPTVVAIVLLPALARLYASDAPRFRAGLAGMLLAVGGLGLPLALGTAALAQPLMDLLYPPQYAAAAPILRWLMVAAWLTAIDQVLSSAMLASEAQHADFLSMALSIAALAAGFALAVPALGPLGAAVAVTLALLARVAWRLRWLLRHHAAEGLGRRLLAGAACAAAGLGGLLAGLPHGALAALAGSWGALLLAGAASGALRPSTLRGLRHWRERWAAGGTLD